MPINNEKLVKSDQMKTQPSIPVVLRFRFTNFFLSFKYSTKYGIVI